MLLPASSQERLEVAPLSRLQTSVMIGFHKWDFIEAEKWYIFIKIPLTLYQKRYKLHSEFGIALY